MIADVFLYTATHGMSWQNPPRDSSEFLELDSCRKSFGSLPNFDCDEKGFEGVKLSERFAYIVRCICARQWDFRGRDSIYMIVARIPREGVGTLNITSLLSLSFFCEPTRTPPSTIDCTNFHGSDRLWHDEILKIGTATGAIRRDIGSRFFRVVRNTCRQDERVRRSRSAGARQTKPVLRQPSRLASTAKLWVTSCVVAFVAISLALCIKLKGIGSKHRPELLANEGIERMVQSDEKETSHVEAVKPLDEVEPVVSFSKTSESQANLHDEKLNADEPFYLCRRPYKRLYTRSIWRGLGGLTVFSYEYYFEYRPYPSSGF